MRLTALDIRKQEFTNGFRGYDRDEVQAFLAAVAEQWDGLVEEQRRLSERLRDLEAKLSHYERVEEALQEALQTARETSQHTVEHAQRKAKLIVEEAQARAAEITRDAEGARQEARRDASRLLSRRNEIVARLRAFLMSEMELLARFDGQDHVAAARMLPRSASAGVAAPDEAVASPEPVERRAAPPVASDAGEAPAVVPAAPRAAETTPPPASRRPEAAAGADTGRDVEDAAPPAAVREGGAGWIVRPVMGPARPMEHPDRTPDTRGKADERRADAGAAGREHPSAGAASAGAGGRAAPADEIEKIRRLLNDLD